MGRAARKRVRMEQVRAQDENPQDEHIRRGMAQAAVRSFPDPVLRLRAYEVAEEHFDASLDALAQRMTDVMLAAGGVGLAAPQLGLLQRVLVVRDAEIEESRAMALVNPVIREHSGVREFGEEGCLSLPQVWVRVPRYTWVEVEARFPDGEKIERRFEGVEAIRVQHEIDHLDGVTILDHVSRRVRREAMYALMIQAPFVHMHGPAEAAA